MGKSYDEIKQERAAENERLYGDIRDNVEQTYDQVVSSNQQGLLDMMTKDAATNIGYGASRLKNHVQERTQEHREERSAETSRE